MAGSVAPSVGDDGGGGEHRDVVDMGAGEGRSSHTLPELTVLVRLTCNADAACRPAAVFGSDISARLLPAHLSERYM